MSDCKSCPLETYGPGATNYGRDTPLFIDNGHGQDVTTGPPPQWTTTPPTESGWYWCRWPEHDIHLFIELIVPDEISGSGLSVVRLNGEIDPLVAEDYIEWWPVRIAEPPR